MREKEFKGVTFGGKKESSKKGVITAFVVLTIIASIFIGVVIYQISLFAAGVQNNWNELKFAYEKPAIVKAVRQDYEKKSAQVDSIYTQEKQTAQDQLILEVTNQLKGATASAALSK